MRPSHPSQSATVPPNANQPLQSIPLAQTQPPFQRQQNKRRAKAIPVIDPATGRFKTCKNCYEANFYIVGR
jgi:hypothetical protein